MNWWYKDVFIDRYTNNEVEQRSNIRRVKFQSIAKLVAGLKKITGELIKNQPSKILMKQSSRAMHRFNDSQLDDIGLTREALYLMSKGKRPVRHWEGLAENSNTRDFELVLCERTNTEANSGQTHVSQSYKKAA